MSTLQTCAASSKDVHRNPCPVVSQDFRPTTNETVLDGNGPNTILASTQREYFGEQERCLRVQHTYILRMGRKSIRTRRLDRNDGAARRVAPEQGPDPKLQNESCSQVSPSQVRDAFGPHDGSEHTRQAIASDGVHSTQQCGPGGLVCSFPVVRQNLSRDQKQGGSWRSRSEYNYRFDTA